MRTRVAVAALALAVMGAGALAQTHKQVRTGHAQPYAGHQGRGVSSLSAEDMQGFLDGRGMGLAKPAELNGYPGPMHVLELADDLELTAEQREHVRGVFDRMKVSATSLGARYVAAEKAVDEAFKSGGADQATIAARVAEANRLLGEVRLSHLTAHLEITPLLTAEQRQRYAELRGYGSSDHSQHRHKH